MSLDFNKTLVIGISSTALFDMHEAQEEFSKVRSKADDPGAISSYKAYMQRHEDTPLKPGTGFTLVSGLLNLNERFPRAIGEPPLVEVIILTRNAPESGRQILNSITHHGLKITRSAFTGGKPVFPYMKAFNVDLFLTTDPKEAEALINNGTCAAAVLQKPPSEESISAPAPEKEIRFAFDGDAVLFSDESEANYKQNGLAAFWETEDADKEIPLNPGPFKKFLQKLALLQLRIGTLPDISPVRIALVTARNAPAHTRPLNTLRNWNIYINDAFFLGGISKDKILKVYQPQIFFDDQAVHIERTRTFVPSGQVPYKKDSSLLVKSQKKDLPNPLLQRILQFFRH